MTRHPDSPAFIAYLRNTIPDLIPPLEDILWTRWDSSRPAPDGMENINLHFWSTALSFINKDGNVSNAGAAFLEDI